MRAQQLYLRHTSSARAARAGSDLVLLHLERGTYYTLNETGAFVWEQLDGRATLGEICAAIVERFEVDSTSAWSDLTALVDELIAEGLAEAVPPQEDAPYSSKTGA
jgi:hypothetical protein